MKSNVEKSAEDKMKSLLKLKETNEYSELEQLYNVGIEPVKQEDVSGAIKGKSTFYSHLKELLETAEKEVILCTTTQEIQLKSRFFALAIDRLKNSKINLQIALSGEEKDIKKINSKFKINAKQIDIDAKFFIADKNQVLFSINKTESPSEEIAVWLNTPFFASSLAFMFEQAVNVK
jgi:sugar-specific transcriptional regulator TrmB